MFEFWDVSTVKPFIVLEPFTRGSCKFETMKKKNYLYSESENNFGCVRFSVLSNEGGSFGVATSCDFLFTIRK